MAFETTGNKGAYKTTKTSQSSPMGISSRSPLSAGPVGIWTAPLELDEQVGGPAVGSGGAGRGGMSMGGAGVRLLVGPASLEGASSNCSRRLSCSTMPSAFSIRFRSGLSGFVLVNDRMLAMVPMKLLGGRALHYDFVAGHSRKFVTFFCDRIHGKTHIIRPFIDAPFRARGAFQERLQLLDSAIGPDEVGVVPPCPAYCRKLHNLKSVGLCGM